MLIVSVWMEQNGCERLPQNVIEDVVKASRSVDKMPRKTMVVDTENKPL